MSFPEKKKENEEASAENKQKMNLLIESDGSGDGNPNSTTREDMEYHEPFSHTPLTSYKAPNKEETEALNKKVACLCLLSAMMVHLAVFMGHYTIISVRWQNVIRLYISLCHLLQMRT